jgi:hypothetical protein
MSQVTNLAFFRGSVVNMSSALGLVGGSGICAYVASKHAIIGLTKDVTFIDKSGEKVLAEFFKEGAELIATVSTSGTSWTTSRGTSRIFRCE